MRYLILILISIFSFLVFASLPPTRLKGGNEAALATTFNFDVGAIPVTRTGTSVVFGTLPVSGGGTGLTSLTAYNLLSGSGTTVNQIAPAASGTILFSTGASSFPTFRSLVNLDVTTALGYTPIASSAASIAEVLGYVPLASSTAAIKSTLGYEPVATVTASSPILITGGVSNPVISLSTSGVTSGASYAKVFVDGYGRVTSGTTLSTSDLPNSGIVSGTYTKVQVTSAGTVISGTTLVNADLPESGVSASTYTKLTVNSKGIVTSGTTLAPSDLPNSGVVSGTYTKVQVTSAGTVVSGTTLVESDIPSLQTTKITSGVFGVDRGGTGLSTTSTGALLIGSGTTTYITLPASTTGTYLKMGTALPEWTTVTPGSVSSTTYQRFTSGSGTYTTPAGVRKIKITIIGGGAGGKYGGTGGSGSSNPLDGGDTIFGPITANGGDLAGNPEINRGGTGGAAGIVNSPAVALVNVDGSDGQNGIAAGSTLVVPGGDGGVGFFGGAGNGGLNNGDAANDGRANTGSGGGGGGTSGGASTISGGGGGAGNYIVATITTPAASYSYTVGGGGAGGNAGIAGNGGSNGGAGGSGFILVDEYY